MQQLLRLRLGIPTVHPLVRWHCDCSDADAVNVPALLERIAPDEVSACVLSPVMRSRAGSDGDGW